MKRLSIQPVFIALLASLGAMTSGTAATITYDLVGSLPTQTYKYTVANDSLGSPIGDFAIFFPSESTPDYADYTLVSAVMPPGWSINLVPGSALDLGAYAEAFVLPGGEIPAGASLGGFEISFAYTGAGIPGSQMFKIYDPSTLDLLETGWTIPASHGVPDTGSTLAGALLAAGLLAGWKSRGTGARDEN